MVLGTCESESEDEGTQTVARPNRMQWGEVREVIAVRSLDTETERQGDGNRRVKQCPVLFAEVETDILQLSVKPH